MLDRDKEALLTQRLLSKLKGNSPKSKTILADNQSRIYFIITLIYHIGI